MRKEIIAIKPHHFVDIITSFGDGQRAFQPHPYGHAVHTISQRILDNRDILLEIELGADDICKPCVHNVSGSCDDTIDTSFRPTAPSSKRDWNLLIDKRWCDRIKLQLRPCWDCGKKGINPQGYQIENHLGGVSTISGNVLLRTDNKEGMYRTVK